MKESKVRDISKGWRWAVLALIALVIAGCGSVGRGASEREAFYRGVYEGCVRESVAGNVVTTFDLLACGQLEERARREDWFGQRVVVGE